MTTTNKKILMTNPMDVWASPGMPTYGSFLAGYAHGYVYEPSSEPGDRKGVQLVAYRAGYEYGIQQLKKYVELKKHVEENKP